jgi:energy-converting hydrogenase B subunit H
MVTNVIFDFRAYDTLGEALILVTAVVLTLMIFGRGKYSWEGNRMSTILKYSYFPQPS